MLQVERHKEYYSVGLGNNWCSFPTKIP